MSSVVEAGSATFDASDLAAEMDDLAGDDNSGGMPVGAADDILGDEPLSDASEAVSGPEDAPSEVSEDAGLPDGAEITDEGDEEEEEAADPDRVQGLMIDGDGQMSLKVGGEKPTLSTVALQGRKIELAGEFRKGDVVELRVTARVGGVHFDDKVNADGDVVDTTRKHILRIEGVEKA